MKWWKQWILIFFSVCSIVVYVKSEMPVVTVSSTYQKSVQLYFVNEEMEVCMVEQSFVCANSLDCILKSYHKLDVLNGVVIEDVVLEEGTLILRMSPEFLLLNSIMQKEAFMMYLLQFHDVQRIKVYVNEKLWDSGLLYDEKKVYSPYFELFTGDLYMSMPLVVYMNHENGYRLRTVRVPYTEEMYQVVSWMLYVSGMDVKSFKECHFVDGVLLVSLKGKLSGDCFEALGLSLLLLDMVDEVLILHEDIEVYHKIY